MEVRDKQPKGCCPEFGGLERSVLGGNVFLSFPGDFRRTLQPCEEGLVFLPLPTQEPGAAPFLTSSTCPFYHGLWALGPRLAGHQPRAGHEQASRHNLFESEVTPCYAVVTAGGLAVPRVDTKPGMSTAARPLRALPPASGHSHVWTVVCTAALGVPRAASCSSLFLMMASVSV